MILKFVLQRKLSGRCKISAINAWNFEALRYSAGVIELRSDELLDRRTRKMMTLQRGLHPKSDVDKLNLLRQRGGKGPISCELCVKHEENNLA